MILELEFADEESAQAYEPPRFVTEEVTDGAMYSGYHLARSNTA